MIAPGVGKKKKNKAKWILSELRAVGTTKSRRTTRRQKGTRRRTRWKKRGPAENGHEGGKIKRETVRAQEGLGREEGEMEKKKKKEDSPGDLRYETLIKIISSASVGCRGAYTTASRECNDLNGNNSVKDGCSRARVHRHAIRCRCASSPPPLPAPCFARFSFCTNGNKKPEVVRHGESCTRVTSSFGRGGFHLEWRL